MLRQSKSRIILGSALLGMILGALAVPSWSAGIESAEVLAGLVRMPSDNPVFMYHTGVYSFWCIQLPALFLKLGVSTWTVAMFSSALELGVAFAAITATSLVFFESALVALMCPLLFTFMIHPTEHGYPIIFLPSFHHFGQMGMYSAILSLGLVSLGYRKSGFLLLGLLPGIHASLAVMAWAAVGIALTPEHKQIRANIRNCLWPFLIGFGFTILTFLIQKIYINPPIYPVNPKLADELMRNFTMYWDMHREPLRWRSFRVDLFIFAYAIYCLYFRKEKLWAGEKTFLTGICGITILAAVYCSIYKLFPQFFLSSVLDTLMLKRWLNFNSIMMPLLAITLLARQSLKERSLVASIGLLAVIALVIWSPSTTLNMEDRKILVGHWQGGHYGKLLIDAIYYKRIYYELGLLLAVALPLLSKKWRFESPSVVRPISLALLIVVLGISGYYFSKIRPSNFRLPDFSPSERIISAYSRQRRNKSSVLILGPAMQTSLQGITMQGLMLDPTALDQVTYQKRSVVKVEEMLNSIYGTSIRTPNDRPRMEEGKDTTAMQNLWESRTASQWSKIGLEFNATSILVSSHWKLQLPVFAESDGVTLYQIPEKGL